PHETRGVVELRLQDGDVRLRGTDSGLLVLRRRGRGECTRARVADSCARDGDSGVRLRDRGARRLKLCLRLLKIRARLLDLRLRDRRVELRDDLPLLDLRVEVGVQSRDRARSLTTDLHGRDGLK